MNVKNSGVLPKEAVRCATGTRIWVYKGVRDRSKRKLCA
jgi:hypothetical protein